MDMKHRGEGSLHGLALLGGSEDVRARGLALLREAVAIREDQSGAFMAHREPLSVAYESYARGLLAVGRPGEALEYLERSEGLHRAEFGRGTWRVRGLLRLRFEAVLNKGALASADLIGQALLEESANHKEWSDYLDDAEWLADRYAATGHPVAAGYFLRAGRARALELQLPHRVERFEYLLNEVRQH